jgi:FlaA1/EpsC-like NDP-sugar epimerase
MALLAAGLHAVITTARRMHYGHHEYATYGDARAVSMSVLATGAILVPVDLILVPRPVPASCTVTGALLALLFMKTVRYVHREQHERSVRPGHTAEPALIFGAGDTGQALTRTLLRDRRGGYLPIGILDDDPDKRQLRVTSVPVLGGREDMASVIRETGARTVIFAVANADADLISDVQRRVLAAGATFKVVPSVAELLDHRVGVADVRDLRPSDLLGRRQIDLDLEPIAGYLTGKRVLVTGAGGSIGSELCRQIQRFAPAELMMLDRDESALHAVQLSLHGRALLDGTDLILADLRDAAAIRAIFAVRRPQVVFHAAALKHLPLLERHPAEAVKTNVRGTQTILEMAKDVERFVNISTDKAANPCSVLGSSKRITERLTAYAAARCPGTFLSVRFGNVLGSRGSVLTAFTAQAASGGPITVTHPDVTRYFMTIQEAVQLVIQAAALGRGGEVLVLDMGKPVRILDVAQQLARQAKRPVAIVYTGLRPGEKLHEELFGDDEKDLRPLHPLVSHVDVPPLDPVVIDHLESRDDPDALIAALASTARAETTHESEEFPGAVPSART